MAELSLWCCKPDAPFKTEKLLRVKLSGDGTCIGKRLHVINFTYSLLDEGVKAHSFVGNHPIAIFREAENYHALKKSLQDVALPTNEISDQVVMTDNDIC